MARPGSRFGLLFLTIALSAAALAACAPGASRSSGAGSVSMPGLERGTISAHDRILQSYGGVYDDAELDAYVTGVVGKIARHADLQGNSYMLTILNSPLANAMALSDGRIYLTRGMLAYLSDEAELAAVLAHEMGHVSARHIASRREVASDIALLDGLVGDLVGGGKGAGLLSRSGLLAGYSRLQESDADRLAVSYLDQAGYDPLAVSDVLSVMNAYTRHRALRIDDALWAPSRGWLANHPDTQDRTRRTAERANALHLSSSSRYRGRGRYMSAINGLLYGMAREKGFVRGNRFVHLVEGVHFEVPSGFHLVNAGDIVWALGPDKVIVKFDQQALQPNVDAAAYLTNDWAGSLALSDVRRFDVGGLPAASAWMRFQGLNTLAVVIVGRPGEAFRFLIGVPPQVGDRHNGDIQSIVRSFGLTDERDAGTGPLEIRTWQTQGRARMSDIATGLKLSSDQTADFLLINGRKGNEFVPAGTILKRIEEVPAS